MQRSERASFSTTFHEDVDTSGASVPVWFEACHVPTFSPLEQDTQADVCVVGAGIAGLTTAYKLLKEGKSVVVLEDGEIASGETGRTTAHLTNALDDRYFDIESLFGAEGSKHAAESHTAAIDLIESIIHAEGIECDFYRVDGFLFAKEGDETTLEKEYTAARKAGLSVEWAEKAPFSQKQDCYDTGKCLKFPRQGVFHPLKYMRGLALAVHKLGGRIFTHTHATAMRGEEANHTGIVETANGNSVVCTDIVVATNVPINDRVTMYTKEHPFRTYVIGARVPKGAVNNALFWDTEDPYHYVRIAKGAVNSAYDVLIVGGEDHMCGHMSDSHEPTKHFTNLEEWTRRRFPLVVDVPYCWSGQIVEPIDDMAFIGRNPGDAKNVYICTGDSGNGLTHGSVAGILLTDLIMGRSNAWEKLYNPSRITVRAAGEFATRNIQASSSYREYLTASDVSDIEEISRCSGAVLRPSALSLTKVAVYKDADGSVCRMSAVCPHLGAVVRWNDYEKSWDCPAHGSRFDRYGNVVNGPANCALTQLDEHNQKIEPQQSDVKQQQRQKQQQQQQQQQPESASL